MTENIYITINTFSHKYLSDLFLRKAGYSRLDVIDNCLCLSAAPKWMNLIDCSFFIIS